MWGLVDLNPTVLASFVNCDLEAAAPRQNLSSDMWTSILVSPGAPLQKLIDINLSLHHIINAGCNLCYSRLRQRNAFKLLFDGEP